jgi:hypothetical protein
MVSVGEETGTFDVHLGQAADFMDSDLDYRSRQLVTLIEPVLIAGSPWSSASSPSRSSPDVRHPPGDPMIGRLRRLHADERGSGLVDGLVASALLGVDLVALIGSLSTFEIASRDAEDRGLAQAILRAQAARIKAAPYQASGDYGAYAEPLPAGFSRTLTVTWWDGTSAWSATANANGLQKVDLAIGAGGSSVATLEFAKAER